MRNKYAGFCCICDNYVDIGAGYFEAHHEYNYDRKKNILKGWFVRCKKCVGVKSTEHRRKDFQKEMQRTYRNREVGCCEEENGCE